jgi:hypothetical protein
MFFLHTTCKKLFCGGNKISGQGNYFFVFPNGFISYEKPLRLRPQVVDSFYLIFTRDSVGNPLEKSLKLYVSSSGLLMRMFAAILIEERVRVTILYGAP